MIFFLFLEACFHIFDWNENWTYKNFFTEAEVISCKHAALFTGIGLLLNISKHIQGRFQNPVRTPFNTAMILERWKAKENFEDKHSYNIFRILDISVSILITACKTRGDSY